MCGTHSCIVGGVPHITLNFKHPYKDLIAKKRCKKCKFWTKDDELNDEDLCPACA